MWHRVIIYIFLSRSVLRWLVGFDRSSLSCSVRQNLEITVWLEVFFLCKFISRIAVMSGGIMWSFDLEVGWWGRGHMSTPPSLLYCWPSRSRVPGSGFHNENLGYSLKSVFVSGFLKHNHFYGKVPYFPHSDQGMWEWFSKTGAGTPRGPGQMK